MADPDLALRLGLFVAEGRLVVERLITAGRYEIQSVLVTETARAAISESLDRLPASVPVFVADPADLRALTGFHLHRGCLALASRPTLPDLASVVAGARTVVVLDAVNDADNVGSIFRNAWALGADAVVLGPTSCDPLYRKAIRTSMAATLLVPFARARAWPGDLRALHALGLDLVAFTPGPAAATIDDFARGLSPERRLALIFGAEGAGLDREVLELSDISVRIPLREGVDSLNVAVASGIALARLGRISVSAATPGRA